ncbi:hypothetical protein PG279_10080 [Riemerella anatipestifer]|nr:hypothetical protein [Riemerella anatipestifer]
MFKGVSTFCLLILANFSFAQREVNIDNLFVFIGQKISVTEFDPNSNSEKIIGTEIDEETGDTLTISRKSYVMDEAYACKYTILKNLFNKISKDTVEFNAYDHYGRPNFENFENVILYLSKNENGKFFHQKYIYDPVFKINGKFYGVLSFIFPNDNLELWRKFKTKDINKDNSIKWKLGFCDKKCQETYYPKPYFEIKNGFAYPKKAFKIDDVLTYRKMTTFNLKSID